MFELKQTFASFKHVTIYASQTKLGSARLVLHTYNRAS